MDKEQDRLHKWQFPCEKGIKNDGEGCNSYDEESRMIWFRNKVRVIQNYEGLE